MTHCRDGGIPLHGRGSGPVAYDIVAGPVTRRGQKVLYSGYYDQVSFHTDAAIAALSQAHLADMSGLRTGLF